MDMEHSKAPQDGERGGHQRLSEAAKNLAKMARKKKPSAPKDISAKPTTVPVGDAQWHRMISEAAYYRAEKRGFAPGCSLDDWLDAESEIRITHAS